MLRYTEREVLPNNVFVFGCGGTGSRTIPPLIQLLKAQTWLLNPNMYLIDGDVVEPKNCSRQHFIEQDVQRNKAEVLSERYSKGFGVDLRYYPHFFEGKTDLSFKSESAMVLGSTVGASGISASTFRNLESFSSSYIETGSQSKEYLRELDLVRMFEFLSQSTLFSGVGNSDEQKRLMDILYTAEAMSNGHAVDVSSNARDVDKIKLACSLFFAPCVVILCVDTAEARRKILSQMTAFRTRRKMFVIDAGNEDIYGQVSFFRADHRVPLMDESLVQPLLRDIVTKSTHLIGREDVRVPLPLAMFENQSVMESTGVISLRSVGVRRVEPFSKNYTPRLTEVAASELVVSLKRKGAHSKEGWARVLKSTEDLLGGCSPVCPSLFPEMSCYSGDISILPMPDLFYDQLQDGEGTRSCADLDQTLAINNLMAASIVNVVNNLVYSLPFTFNTIRISLNGGYSVDHLSHYWYKNMLMGNDSRYSNHVTRWFWEAVTSEDKVEREKNRRTALLTFLTGNYLVKCEWQKGALHNHMVTSAKPVWQRINSIANNIAGATHKFTDSESDKALVSEICNFLSALGDIARYSYERKEVDLKAACELATSFVKDCVYVDELFTFMVRTLFNNVLGIGFRNFYDTDPYVDTASVMIQEIALMLVDDFPTPLSGLVEPRSIKQASATCRQDAVNLLAGYISKGDFDLNEENKATLVKVMAVA